MKIRNGFVSNSSSSSFILVYDKNKVTNDPKEVVDYLKKNPNGNVIFRGNGWCGEGEDIFELDEDVKTEIRKFPDNFIEINSGTLNTERYVYTEETHKGNFEKVEVPKITAYLGNDVYLQYDDLEFRDFEKEVDTSDMGEEPFKGISFNEIMSMSEDDREKQNSWYREIEKRARKLRKEYMDKSIKDISDKSDNPNVVAEYVDVSRSTNEDVYDFREKYLSRETEEEYSFVKRYNKYADKKPYVILYDEIIENKEDIIQVIKNFSESERGCFRDDLYLVRYNDVLEDADELNIDFYSIDDNNAKLVTSKSNSKKFINSNVSAKLFVNASVYNNGDEIYSKGQKALIGFGRYAVIDSDDDYDFKKTFIPSCK